MKGVWWTPLPASIIKRLFGIPYREVTAARRGFSADDPVVTRRLERIGHTFLQGYHAAIENDDPAVLNGRLQEIEPEFRGFAFEGAGMGLALLDYLPFGTRGHLARFLAGPGAPYKYLVYVGAGWLSARLRKRAAGPTSGLDPLLGWLTFDGYGFHDGYFYWRRSISGMEPPARLSGYARRVYDQGLGRSLWFVKGANPGRIAESIQTFPETRRADLWSGVGLACAYAGGVDRSAVRRLREAPGAYLPHVAQGAAFAAKTRHLAGNLIGATEIACEILCGVSAEDAALITDSALADLPPDGAEPAYETWRKRIREQFQREIVKL